MLVFIVAYDLLSEWVNNRNRSDMFDVIDVAGLLRYSEQTQQKVASPFSCPCSAEVLKKLLSQVPTWKLLRLAQLGEAGRQTVIIRLTLKYVNKVWYSLQKCTHKTVYMVTHLVWPSNQILTTSHSCLVVLQLTEAFHSLSSCINMYLMINSACLPIARQVTWFCSNCF